MSKNSESAPRAPRTEVSWTADLQGNPPALVTNFSPTGLYLKMDGPTAIGGVVRLVIDIEGPGSGSKLIVSGVVARMEDADGSVGIGIKFTDSPQLISNEGV